MPALTRSPSDRNDSPSPDPDSPDSYQPAYSAAPKRKASEEDLSDGPSQKSPHTEDSRRQPTAGPSRRKSTSSGAPPKDETRLLKRKEQNRAAQRAFRERKEKHVKDLEDKVADLEAKNEQAQHENENLRDLLQRLQSENVALKQSAFSFSMPSNIGSTNTSFSMPPQPQQPAPKLSNPLDWSSLTTFDPSILNLLDDPLPQPTATDGAMQLDFGFGHASPGLDSNAYTTIATNPLFMSFASNFDSVPSSDQNIANAYVPPPQPAPPLPATVSPPSNNFTFDMGPNFGWTPPPVQAQDMGFDDLFSGYFGSLTGNDPSIFHAGPSNPAVSPISHPLTTPLSRGSPSSTSSLSSPLVSTPDSLDKDLHAHSPDTCPRTKSELKQRIEEEGSSPFAPTLRKSSDQVLGTMISCAGSKFPKTVKSDQNIEVLTAWRSIISDPQFKNVDVNELCQEFTSKARCDGTMVVLEPQGVHQIFESLAKK